MNLSQNKWLILTILSLIWGSSFILIKKGLVGLSPVQLGALRVVFTGVFLFSVGYKSLKTLHKSNYKWIVLSGFIGTFFPAFLFAFAETEVDSAVVSILNSLTPLNTILIGLSVFKIGATRRQFFGVIIGFVGTAILIAAGADLNPNQNYLYAGFIILASVMYGINVNLIKRYLQNEKPLAIATGNFIPIVIPAFLILIFSGFFDSSTLQVDGIYSSIGYVLILSIFGTALAKVFFNNLVQISSPVFASSVTYVMTIVAIIWGVLDGERIGFIQIVGGAIILFGVYLANKKRGN
ncbi:DMT family transporter [Urechidicola vernalis]|uniref:EamA family transporter n=1 Tax=Urechidicola vernalis TaxID=3075600 RepID=A0ABU2Y714_9FLAO|nr:EamA family transporter [Urechidicola sp. P050]MDT0553986.1 EamA family transporter [Urechidicola sp. P050]